MEKKKSETPFVGPSVRMVAIEDGAKLVDGRGPCVQSPSAQSRLAPAGLRRVGD